ncbi:reticulocyte binding protein, putative [Plasmodium gallinaceum]|uniref:Reticulocyte binding protein, putative n=1 Tax=Plasmodium gallinaceum TaxID=5849 RepID=A0A1J1H405_PLAGA|nr:reticulocyte binding protein, putative [Plasmodium gallinaceum]CRG98215.1 reticulocyte binding protein, putative [Plasmodium gallinaceum]
MGKIKISIVYLILVFVFLDLYYEEKVKVVSTMCKSDMKKLSSVSNLVEKKSLNEYNMKEKKKSEISIPSNQNNYNKKTVKLKNEDKKTSYLYKQPIILKNYNTTTYPLYIISKDKNIPYISRKYIFNEGKQNILGNISHSFFEMKAKNSIDTELLNSYKSLITEINEKYNRGKDRYIVSFSYLEMEHYFKEEDNTKKKYTTDIIPSINNIKEKIEKYISYCEKSKDELIKGMNKLEELVENSQEGNMFTEKCNEFKSKIEEIKSTLITDYNNIEQENWRIYHNIDSLLCQKYCNGTMCNNVKSVYESAIEFYYNKIKVKVEEFEFLKELDDFMKNDSKLSKILDKNFYHKHYKFSLKLLLDEIKDILEVHTENQKVLSNNMKSFTSVKEELSSFKFYNYNITQTVTFPPFAYHALIITGDWDKTLKSNFYEKKEAIHNLYDKIKKELGEEINSLVYPAEVESNIEQIVSNVQKILSNVNNITSENCEVIEGLPYKYSDPKISTTKSELNNLCTKLDTHNTDLKSKLGINNEKHNSIKTQKSQIKTLKESLKVDENQLLNDITDDVISTKERIEKIITSANEELEELKRKNNELNGLKSEIDKLITQVQAKSKELKELERKEEEAIKENVKNIESYLEQIEEKMNKLKTLMDLKDSENEDLKIIEKVIDASSCDNKEKYTAEREEAKGKRESALASLFDSKKIEKAYIEIPSYVSEKKKLNYKIYDLNKINDLLKEVKQKSSEIDNIVKESSTIMNDKIIPAENYLTQIRNNIITESIEDLYSKMENSYQNFNIILGSINENLINYEQKVEILKTCENDITKRKCEFMEKLIEEDSDSLKGKDSSQDTLNLKDVIKEKKNLISTKISDGRDITYNFKKQFELYSKIEKFYNILQNDEVSNKLKNLKTTIQELNADGKLNEHQERYNSATHSIDDSIKKVELSKKIIETVKVLNKIINGCNRNEESIEHLKGKLKESDENISREISSINDDNLIEGNVKERLLSKLNEKKKIVEDKIKEVDEVEKKLKVFLQNSVSFKETIGNIPTEENLKIHSKDISGKKENLESITNTISSLKVGTTTINLDVDSLINSQNNEIADLVYNLIVRLDQDINSKVETSLGTLEVTKKSFEEYKYEKDIKNIYNDTNKVTLSSISQNFDVFKGNISMYEKKFVEIKTESKNDIDESDNIKKINENFNEKRINMKKKYEKMKTILEKLNTLEADQLELLKNINEKKLEYKKTLVYDSIDQITYIKRKGEEEIAEIDLCKGKIEQLETKIPDDEECGLDNFNYEEYAKNSKRNQEEINKSEQEVSILKESISNSQKEEEIDSIQIKVEQKLKDVLKEKSNIDNTSKIIKHMEKLLMLTKFSIVMDDLQSNSQNVKEEEEKAKTQLTESGIAKDKIMEDYKNAEELRDLLINQLDDSSIDRRIEEIRLIKSKIASYIKTIYGFLRESEKHKVAALLYFKNTLRGKGKIEYLKNHDSEGKEINEQVLKDVEKYVHDSQTYSNMADKDSEETSKNYELSLEYGKKMDNLFKNSLLIAEKNKVKMRKSVAGDIFAEIQNDYYNNKNFLEILINKLIILKQENAHMEKQEDANNEKSLREFYRIEITRTKASNTLIDTEEIKNRILGIINAAEIEMKSISVVSERSYEDVLDELKMEQDNLKNVSRILREFENKKKHLKIELNKFKDIETKVNNMEAEMKIYKTSFEEGILLQIKKIADEEKKNIELLKESIKLTIDTSINFLKDSVLGADGIIEKFENPQKKLNEMYDSFDKSYKEIEKDALSILDSSNTYSDVKDKKEKAKVEKEKLKELNKEIKILLNNIRDIKINETLKLILYMKGQLDEVKKIAHEEYLYMEEYTKEIKKNIENIKKSKCVNIALEELINAKNKGSQFNQRKLKHDTYRDKAYSILNEIFKASEFINMSLETIWSLEGFKEIKDIEGIILGIQKDSADINNKEKENEENIMNMKNIYEQIKVRDKIKKKIGDTKNEIDKLLRNAQNSLEKYREIRELNFDETEYYEILKNSKDYTNFKKLINSYYEKYNQIGIEENTDSIITELNKYKNSLNDMDELIEISDIEYFTTNILEKVKDDINTITNKIVHINNSILGFNASFCELLELRRNCKLYFLSLIVTSINNAISKDKIIIEKNKKNVSSCVEYVLNNYNYINNDIYTTNKCLSRNFVSFYGSNNVENLNKLSENFKIKKRDVIKKMGDLENAFLDVNEKKNSNLIDEYMQEVKYLYKEFKRERINLKNIFKKINEIELKDLRDTVKKFFDIAESYEDTTEYKKEKILYIKNELKEIEDFIKKGNQELLRIGDMHSEEKTQKVNEIYENIMNEFIKVKELENDNNNENNQLDNHENQISHLIERTNCLFKFLELYQYNNDHYILQEEDIKIENEVNNYLKNLKIWIKESMRIFENIKISIDENKKFIHENMNIILSIYDIINNINNIKKNYQQEVDEKKVTNNIKKQVNEIKEIKDNNVIINNNTNFQYNERSHNREDNSEIWYGRIYITKIKLTETLVVLLLFCSGIILFLFKKKKNNKDNKDDCNKNEINLTYERSFRNTRNIDRKEEYIEASFV